MKRYNHDFDREKKVRKVLKGTDKSSKHRKSLYNMLTDEEDNFDSVDDTSDVENNYSMHSNVNYTKQR